MKEATGELNMTVVTLIAVAALGALFYFVVWPMVQRMVVQQTCNTYGDGWKATRTTDAFASQAAGNAKVYKWQCCPVTTGEGGQTNVSSSGCIDVDADNSGSGGNQTGTETETEP